MSAPRPTGQRLRAAREAKGWTQDELADRVSEVTGDRIRNRHISRYELETAEVSATRWFAIAYALGVDYTDLLEYPAPANGGRP